MIIRLEYVGILFADCYDLDFDESLAWADIRYTYEFTHEIARSIPWW